MEIPTTEKFREDARKIMDRITTEGRGFPPIIEVIIAHALLQAHMDGGNRVLNDMEQKILLMRCDPITKA